MGLARPAGRVVGAKVRGRTARDMRDPQVISGATEGSLARLRGKSWAVGGLKHTASHLDEVCMADELTREEQREGKGLV